MAKKKRPPLADRLIQGMQEALLHAQGEIQLKTHELEIPDEPTPDSAEVAQIRESLNASIPVFAQAMNVSATTVKKWESGKARPSGPAVRLLYLYRRNPHLATHSISASQSPPSWRTKKAASAKKSASRSRSSVKVK